MAGEGEGGGNVIDFPNEPWKRPGYICSDDNIAAAFDLKHDGLFCYSLARKSWRWFDGQRWINARLRLERAIGEFLADEIGPVVGRRAKDKARIGATSKLLSVERRLRSIHDVDETVFDAAPLLLNNPAGTQLLPDKDGSGAGIRKHDHGDYITKMTAADPAGDCPEWRKFIDWVTRGDTELAGYLQRLCGYALAGVAAEQMFAFIYGSGGNGKSVFLQTLLYVLGDYGVSCPASVWIEQPFERHPEELMRLKGARLIVSSEVPADAKWNVERIKAVTGGETIVARGMRENSCEFAFTGTLLIAGNNKPQLANVDEAIRRRIHIIPFKAHVADEKINKHLTDELKAEAGGILKWMIEGCRNWRSEGLKRPKAVETATEEYLADEDHLKQWREECCDFHEKGSVSATTSELFGSWKKWCEKNGLRYGSVNQFSERLANSGVERHRQNDARGFKGIAVKVPKARGVSGDDR